MDVRSATNLSTFRKTSAKIVLTSKPTARSVVRHGTTKVANQKRFVLLRILLQTITIIAKLIHAEKILVHINLVIMVILWIIIIE